MKVPSSTIVFSISALSLLILPSCRQKESNCPYDHTTNVNHNISQNNKANAYYGYDTLVFISNAGDTATLYGQGKRTYFELATSGQPPSADCGGPEYTYHDENFELVFTGSNSELSKIGYHGFIYTSGYPFELIDFTVNSDFGYKKGGGLSYFNDSNNYTTKITINGNDYYCLKYDYYMDNNHPLMYINRQFKILKIDSLAGKNWTLNK